MKKLLLLATVTAALASLSGFAQGYFLFTSGPGGVWDATGATARKAATNRVAFLWGSGAAQIASIMSSVPTNNSTQFSYDAAWTAILGDPNFHLALNNTDSSLATVLCAGNGGWSFAASGTFPVQGTAPGPYQLYVIGWSAQYLDPVSAQAGHSPVGWSNPFTYTSVAQIGTPLSMTASGLLPFGVGALVPEPTTFAIAGLGAAAMLIFRRRK